MSKYHKACIVILSFFVLLFARTGRADEYQQYIRVSCIPEINRMEFQVLNIHAEAEIWNTEDVKKEAELQEKFGLYRTWELIFDSKKTLEKNCLLNGKTIRMVGRYSDFQKNRMAAGPEVGIDLDVYEDGKHIIHYAGFGGLFGVHGLDYYDTPKLIYDGAFGEVHVCGKRAYSLKAPIGAMVPCIRIWPQQGVNFVDSNEIFNVIQNKSDQIFNQRH